MSQARSNSPATINDIFKPLDRAQKEIRLVSLQPAFLESDTIVCTLEHARLEDRPKYSALSWAWGDANQTEMIVLEGREWLAPRNLVIALRAFRQKLEPWRAWIDAICINQSQDSEALKERGHQVQLMQDIYANTERLLAWTGESQLWTSDFFNCMRQLAESHITISQACAVIQSVGREDHNEDLTFIKWLWEFVTRAWWRRLWILQEMVLAPKAVLVCGQHMILLDQVLTAFLNIRRVSNRLDMSRADSQRMISIGALIATIEDLGKYGPSKLLDDKISTSHHYSQAPKKPDDGFLCFSKLITACRFRLSSDPRDKIYGLLGMAQDVVAMNLMPHYDRSVAEVYTQTAWTLIRKTASLFILSQAQISLWESSDSNSCVEGLPSWVPDWSVKRQSLGYSVQTRCQSRLERGRHFSTCLRPRGEVELIGYSVLKLRGFKVDIIASLCKIWETYNGDCFPNLGFFHEWTRKQDSSGSHELYVSGGTRINAYWRSWVHDMLPAEDFLLPEDARRRQPRRCVKKFVEDCEAWRISFSSDSPNPRPPFPYPVLVQESTFSGIRFIVTEDNFLGLGNATMLPGDMVYVLAGGSHPFVIRPEVGHSQHYKLIGECYLHGIMDGQALRNEYGPARRRRGESSPQLGHDTDSSDIWETVFLV